MTAQTEARPEVAVPPIRATRAGRYLTFTLGQSGRSNNTEFGIHVKHVREILGVQEITAVPGTQAPFIGAINLRGKIVPVVDLRLKLRFPEAAFTPTTCLIVVQVMQEGEQALIGLIVDGVSAVLTLSDSDIEDAPDFGGGVDPRFVLGMAKVKDSAKILLKVEGILSLPLAHARGSVAGSESAPAFLNRDCEGASIVSCSSVVQ